MIASNNNFYQSKREATDYAKKKNRQIVYLYVDENDQYVFSLEPVETPYIFCAVKKDNMWYWKNRQDRQIDCYEA